MYMGHYFGHAGAHTTEGITHFLSGWHLMLIVFSVAIIATIIYLLGVKPGKADNHEREDI